MTSGATVAAVDLGASSGRVMVARVEPGRLELTEAARFGNVPVRTAGVLHWDVLRLYRGVLEGLHAAGSAAGRIDAIGIDSWGVDFGLIDADGRLLGNPVHYRDRRTDGLERLDLFRETGIQHLPFNTVYQLIADPPPPGATLLLIPDLICYWLTGAIGAEVTNASTTQLLDVHTRRWHSGLTARLGLDEALLPPLRQPGEPIGFLTQETGMPPTPVIAVGSHDTASAVAGVPAAGPRFGYIACGTWSLVGVELDSPVLTEDARKANFTNEAGVDGKVRFLRNVMGLWLLQECLRQWEVPLDGLLEEAAGLSRGAVIDADDPEFLAPGDMPARIASACERTGQPVPSSRAAVVRCIVDSLASAHARALADAQRISGVDVDVVHLVGGGARNPLLCRLTADACGVPVEAGPVEATALGNALVQARALGAAPPDLAGMRSLLRATQPIQRYTPTH